MKTTLNNAKTCAGSLSGYKSAIQDGYLKVTQAMLQEQKNRIERIEKQREIMQCDFTNANLTEEQMEKITYLEKIKNIENVYLRIMQRKMASG